MMRSEITEKLAGNAGLLSLPQVLSELLEEVNKEDYNAESLAVVILKDPSLTSKILRMSNSSFYGRYSEISTVQQAISIMGATTVKCLALSSSIFHPEVIDQQAGIDTKEFFAYNLSIAAACRNISDVVGYSADEAFITGLLHEIGVIFLLHNYPSEYNKVFTATQKNCSLSDAELKVFGIDHCEISEMLAKQWHLPDNISEALDNHHTLTYDESSSTLSKILRLAVLITKDRFSGYDPSIEKVLSATTEYANGLNIPKESIDNITGSLIQETLDIAEYLGLDIGNIEEMLMKANHEILKSYLIIENLFKERQDLTKSLLEEERKKGALESQNIAMATMSHYLNNTVMGISGRTELMRMLLKKGKVEKIIDNLPDTLEKYDNAVMKIVAIIEEMKEVSPIDQKKFDSFSKAMNIDDLIEDRMARMLEQEKKALEMAAEL